jgi:hypothetical protein
LRPEAIENRFSITDNILERTKGNSLSIGISFITVLGDKRIKLFRTTSAVWIGDRLRSRSELAVYPVKNRSKDLPCREENKSDIPSY